MSDLKSGDDFSSLRERFFYDTATELDRRLSAVRALCEPIAAPSDHSTVCDALHSHGQCLAARVLRILNGEDGMG